MLEQQIRDRMKAAMKAHRTVEKEILRVALGEITTEQARRAEPMDEGAIEKILRKLVKANNDTIAVSDDAAAQAALREEIAVLESLLPKTLGVDEITVALEEVRDQILGAAGDGQATGVAMKMLKARGAVVDGKTVAAAVARMRAG